MKYEYIKCETIHKIFAVPLGIISKSKKHNREKKKNILIRKRRINSLARMEPASVLREGLMSFMYNIS